MVKDGQVYIVGDPNQNGSTDPSHSQLAKDHDDHPFHTLAAKLAKQAVKFSGEKIGGRWWGGDDQINPVAIIGSLINHPFNTEWQDLTVRSWASSHQQQIVAGSSATRFAEQTKAHEKEVKEIFAAIKKTSKARSEMWDYVATNYKIIFSK